MVPKKAMELLSLCRGELRLPLCEISEENAVNIKAALKEYGLLDNKNGIRNKLSE